MQGTGRGTREHAPATRRRATVAALAIVVAALLGAVDAPGALALSIDAPDIKPPEQTSFTGEVARLVDRTWLGLGGCPDKSRYGATVTWADNTTSTGTIGDFTADNSGNCYYAVTVPGGHLFGDENPGGEQVRIDASGPFSSTASRTITALIQDAPLHADAAPAPSTIVEGSPLSAKLASFKDDNASAPASDFSATIDWHDGSPPDKTASITPKSTGGFDVNASHVYVAAGTYRPTITISDDGTATSTTATVSVTATLNATEIPIKATQGSPFTGAVAGFTDPNPVAKASDFSATIDWSDGSPIAAGTVAAAPGGGFLVSGSHTYAKRPSGPAIVTIVDVDGAMATVATGVSFSPSAPPAGGSPAPASPASNPQNAGVWTTTANTAVPVVRVGKPRFLRPAAIVVELSCPPGPACRGELKVLTVPASGKNGAPLRPATVLGSTLFILDGGASETFDVRLGKRLRRRLARAGSATVRAYATDFTPHGQRASVSEVGVIRPRAR